MKFRGKTVKVILENDWHTPYGFINKDQNGFPIDIDANLIPILPSTARIVDDNYQADDERIVIPTPQAMGMLARDLYDEQLAQIKAAQVVESPTVSKVSKAKEA